MMMNTGEINQSLVSDIFMKDFYQTKSGCLQYNQQLFSFNQSLQSVIVFYLLKSNQLTSEYPITNRIDERKTKDT